MIQSPEQTQTNEDANLLLKYEQVRDQTVSLSQKLTPEDCAIQPMPDASPIKWHLAHTTWFFETFVLRELAHYRPFDPSFGYLFNSYYNKIGQLLPRGERGFLSRPGLKEIFSYRESIDEQMGKYLRHFDPLNENVRMIIETGIHHEQQHQELMLMDVKYLFWKNPIHPEYTDRVERKPAQTTPKLEWAYHAEGVYEIGHNDRSFSFDNERPFHKNYVPSFSIASRLVTNGEYLSFIKDCGYSRPELWLSDGWSLIQENQSKAPLYWKEHDGSWSVFTLSGMKPLCFDEPVCHVNYYEADAFARWTGAQLPTEFEWETAAKRQVLQGNFLENGTCHPEPASQFNSDPTQFFGDVWEWTRSSYAGYPGYRPHSDALGEYNGKFMSNQYVLRGGSCVTPKSHIRATYRNFFPPSKNWFFGGIRLAREHV